MTTGSTVKGTVDGIGLGLGTTSDKIIQITDGNPSGIITVAVTSGIAYDQANGQYYMGLSDETWVALGSQS